MTAAARLRTMIIVDENEPDEDLDPPFPPRNVEVKVDVDMRKYYDLQNEIGRGRFGTVYLCNDKDTSQKFAAKFVNTKRNQDRENVEREIEIMKVLNQDKPHPLMIQLYDAFDVGKEMCLILEVVDGGELFERVIDDDFVLTERACAIFTKQICQALEFIHSKNVLHLDMKPENILCLSREGNRVKICDFGLARKFDPKKKLQVLFGTPEFVAPEVVNFEPISFGTDMWSVGVICYVLLSGLSPFMGHDYVETMTNVTKNKYDFDDEVFDTVSEEAKDFIRRLLVLDKSLRPSPEQCYRHQWFRKLPPKRVNNNETVSESEDEKNDSSIEEKFKKEEKEKEKDEILQTNNYEKKNHNEIKGEELKVSKDNLKENVERWNSHPNSPYNVKTLEPLDVQGGKIRGKSRSSHSDDELGEDDKDEFTCYTIEKQKPVTNIPPADMVKQLEEKLSKLKHNDVIKDDIHYKQRTESKGLTGTKEDQIKIQEEGKRKWGDDAKKSLEVTPGKNKESALSKAKAEAQKALEESRKYKEQVLKIQEQSRIALEEIKRIREREEAKRGILNRDLESKGKIPKEPMKRPESPTVQKYSNISTKPATKTSVNIVPGVDKQITDVKKSETSQNSHVLTHSSQTSKHQQSSKDLPIPIQSQQEEDVPETALLINQQKISRDAPHLLELKTRRGSKDSTGDKSFPSSRKTSESEPPHSWETDRSSKERTPGANAHKRPSRDMPLSGAELEHLAAISVLGNSAEANNIQLWPDLMIGPQHNGNSLNIPANGIGKSSSGTSLLSSSDENDQELNRNKDEDVLPQSLSKEKSDIKHKNANEKSQKSESSYVAPNNLVAWILDIGTTQAQTEQRQTPLSDRVNQWEKRDKLFGSPSSNNQEILGTSRPVSPFGQALRKEKSSTNLSTSFSATNLQSSPSTDDLVIQTPWGPAKRSPSRTSLSRSSSGNRLSKSPSFDVPSLKCNEHSSSIKDHDHLHPTRSLTRSPSPMSISTIESNRSNIQSPNSTEMMEPKYSKSSLRTIDEPSTLVEKNYQEPKYNSLPRSAKLSKTRSTDSISSARSSSIEKGKKTTSIESIKEVDNDTLKRKSKTPLPPLPGQKKPVGMPSLFSAKERISLFEQKKETRPPQRPFTRTRSNVVFDKFTSADKAIENSRICDENKNPVSTIYSSKSNNTQIEYLMNRLQNKNGKPPLDIINNSDSVNNNSQSSVYSKRGK
ncbi:unnamed protein product, partial [Meganyctiphanes norvegica]